MHRIPGEGEAYVANRPGQAKLYIWEVATWASIEADAVVPISACGDCDADITLVFGNQTYWVSPQYCGLVGILQNNSTCSFSALLLQCSMWTRNHTLFSSIFMTRT
jgi:hypothetical protein